MHASASKVQAVRVMVGGVLQLPQVLDAIQLSHATFNKIRQNLWWAFGYNLVGIPLAAGALLPSMGIALTPSISGQYAPTFTPFSWDANLCLRWHQCCMAPISLQKGSGQHSVIGTDSSDSHAVIALQRGSLTGH